MALEQSVKLPPARRRPLPEDDPAWALLPGPAKLLLAEVRGDRPRVAVRTRSGVDVGSWRGKARIWACAFRGELVLLAPGRRPYTERIPLTELNETIYNHVMGELALSPAAGAATRALRVAPVDGYQLLAQIHDKDSDDGLA